MHHPDAHLALHDARAAELRRAAAEHRRARGVAGPTWWQRRRRPVPALPPTVIVLPDAVPTPRVAVEVRAPQPY